MSLVEKMKIRKKKHRMVFSNILIPPQPFHKRFYKWN